MDAWLAAYASSVCLAIHVLFQEDLGAGRIERLGFSSLQPEEPELASMPWFRINRNDPNLFDGKLKKLLIILHTLAIRALSYFIVELRTANANVQQQEIRRGSSKPPLINEIPLFSLLELPDPFSDNALAAFATCHLARMTDPAFIEDGEWTGYSSFTGRLGRFLYLGSGHDWFDPIGAENEGVRLNRLQNRLAGRPAVERAFRFQFVRSTGTDRYLMRSNYVQTSVDVFSLELAVERDTGYLEITKTGYFGETGGISYAVMTPFGIMASGDHGGPFLWMWKTEWSV
jgi:hypothetical protein